MTLPKDILGCVERVLEYHRVSKLAPGKSMPAVPVAAQRPAAMHKFDGCPVVALPTTLRDLPTPTAAILEDGPAAADDVTGPVPQDQKTLASWLYMAVGGRERHAFAWGEASLRAVPSTAASHPAEVYVAAFAIEGLEPGLYHFRPKSFTLHKLRDGRDTLALLRRGRPDLQFLGTVPCAILVSSVFSRSSWAAGRRGYRQAVIDTGRAIENLHVVATGLGMATITRLRLTDSCTRELIGLDANMDAQDAEAVHGMIVFADAAARPMDCTGHHLPPTRVLPTIARRRDIGTAAGYGSVLTVHQDTAARGVAVREVRPPLTELSPLPGDVEQSTQSWTGEPRLSRPLRKVLLHAREHDRLDRGAIDRDCLTQVAQISCAGGTYYPLLPTGAAPAIVRPFWVVNDVTNKPRGIWYYNPLTMRWSQLAGGNHRKVTGHLACNAPFVHDAAAVCVIVANLRHLLHAAGPDLYRLALLEAGVIVQRMTLIAASYGLATQSTGDFFDDAVKHFLGLTHTGWEALVITALGHPEAKNT